MSRRRAKEGEGVRTRVGERIEAWPCEPVDTYFSVKCPVCFRQNWHHNLSGYAPADDAPGFAAEWHCEPLEVGARQKWPRKPDGGRGFHFETLPPSEIPVDVVRELYVEFARRQAVWLRMFERDTGIDAATLVDDDDFNGL